MRQPGKKIGYTTYVHKLYFDTLSRDELDERILTRAKEALPYSFSYEIIKYNYDNGNVTFIYSPDWNTADEPIVGDAVLVKMNGSKKITKQKSNPQIYHHKWMFVADTYSGFDVERSKLRSKQYANHPELDKAKMGYKSYWDEFLKKI